MYCYLISSGCFSDYTVNQVAIHEKHFTLDELKQISDDVKIIYSAIKYRGIDKREAIQALFEDRLRDYGFKVVYPVGEFAFYDYEYPRAEYLHFTGEVSEFRVGIA
jgi:hypothetical protein